MFKTRVNEITATVKRSYGLMGKGTNKIKPEFKWLRLAKEKKAKIQEEVCREMGVKASTAMLAA